jgi:hypothetical protein
MSIKSPKQFIQIGTLVVFVTSLIPSPGYQVQAEEMVQRSLDDAISLMYVNDAILFGDVDQEEASRSSGLFSPVYDGPETDLDNGKLAAMIHAAKMERNDRDKNCEILINQNRKAGKDCEADRLKESCAARKAAINARIGKLHKLRGDRRKSFTKMWHFFKRQGRTAWHKLGPSGRRFFHKMGPDLMQMVATGGFSGSAFKTIFKAHLKRTFGKKQISKMVLKGIQRRMMGQIEIAQAAGLDICDSTESKPESTTEGTEEEVSQDAVLTYSLTTEEIEFWWSSMFEPREDFHVCRENWPEGNDFNPIEFQLTIDPQKGTIQAKLEGSREIKTTYEGALWNQINQNFIVVLEGPYQLTEKVAELVLYFQGSGTLTITQSGKVNCHYWEVPSSGDPVLIEYEVEGNETKTLAPEYLMIISTEDQNTVKLQLRIGYEMEPWGINTGFYIISEEYELSPEELDEIWPD